MYEEVVSHRPKHVPTHSDLTPVTPHTPVYSVPNKIRAPIKDRSLEQSVSETDSEWLIAYNLVFVCPCVWCKLFST